MSELIGRTLDRYQIIEQIGKGGMATIFKSYQPGLDRYVAIKVLPPTHAKQAGFNERFQREAKAIANLHHPNILPVYDFGQEGEYSFIIMRYIENAFTLKDLMKTQIDLTRIVEIVGQIARALDHAHQHGVIHRDVKPSNVLMDGDWALLTDFGLAKMTEVSVQLTGSGVGVGTPAYMSPEQGQGGEIDLRSDVYSLGIILFEMLTGQIPHNAETPFAIVLKRVTEPLPMPRSLNAKIPEAVERVLLKALARAPSDRYDSVGEMALAFKKAAHDSTTDTMPDSVLPQLPVEPVLTPMHQAPVPVYAPEPIPVQLIEPVKEPPKQVPPPASKIPAAAPTRPGIPWLWVGGIASLVLIVALLAWGLGSGWWGLAKPSPTQIVPATATPAAAVAVATLTLAAPSGRAYYEQGVRYVNQSMHQQAFEQFDLALEHGYESADLYYYRGYACHNWQYNLGGCDYMRAITEYDKAIEMDPTRVLYYEDRAWTYVHLFEHQRAADDYSKAIELVPNNIHYYIWRGERYEALPDLDAALADYNKAIEMDAARAENYWSRGRVYERQGELDKALADFNTGVELAPDDIVAFSERARYYERQNMIDEARADYERVLTLLEGLDGYDNTRSDVLAWLAENPGTAIATPTPGELTGRAYYERGVEFMNQEKDVQALEQFDLALEHGYESAELYHDRGLACHGAVVLYGECDMLQAIADYTKAIELDPQNDLYYERRAWSYVQVYDYEHSVADLTEAIKLNPTYARYYQLRGGSYDDMDDLDAALVDYNKAIEIDSNYTESYHARAGIYERQGNDAAALADLDTSVEIDPTNPQAFHVRGMYYQRRDMIDEARADYEKFLVLAQDERHLNDLLVKVQAWLAEHPVTPTPAPTSTPSA